MDMHMFVVFPPLLFHTPDLHAVPIFAPIKTQKTFTAAVWCVPAVRVPLVHSLINHFRQNTEHTDTAAVTDKTT